MKKTLTALLLALTSAWAVDQNPVVEMYPDDMPKSQLVFTMQKEKTKEWDKEAEWGIYDSIFGDLDVFFSFQKLTCLMSHAGTFILEQTAVESSNKYVFLYINGFSAEDHNNFLDYFSWKSIDQRLKNPRPFFHGEEVKALPPLYDDIKTIGLRTSFIRLCITADKNRLYSFYVLYDEENEKKIGEKILMSVKTQCKL